MGKQGGRIGYTRLDKKIKGSHNGGIYGRDKKATEKNFHGRVQETDGGFIQRGKAKGGNRKGKENYGTRQIKTSLAGKGIVMSRRKSCRLMKELGLLSDYGIPKYTKPDTKSAGQTKLTFRICSAEISAAGALERRRRPTWFCSLLRWRESTLRE